MVRSSLRSSGKSKSIYAVVDYEVHLPPVRIKRADLLLSRKIVSHDDETYDSLSHYVRCAIIRLNRAEKQRLRL